MRDCRPSRRPSSNCISKNQMCTFVCVCGRLNVHTIMARIYASVLIFSLPAIPRHESALLLTRHVALSKTLQSPEPVARDCRASIPVRMMMMLAMRNDVTPYARAQKKNGATQPRDPGARIGTIHLWSDNWKRRTPNKSTDTDSVYTIYLLT